MPDKLPPDPERGHGAANRRRRRYDRRYRARQKLQNHPAPVDNPVPFRPANLAHPKPLSAEQKRRRERHRKRRLRARDRWRKTAAGRAWAEMRVRTLEELILAFRARREELGLSQLELDDLAGLQDGYTGKIEAGPVRGRSFGEVSLPLILDALGVRLVLVPKDAAP